jgi:LemA protein
MGAFVLGFIILLVIVAALAFYAVSLYNGFVRSRNLIQESWRQVDVELNRRYDLIPNLVETVRAYAAHERNTLENVTRLRNQAAALAQATPGQATAERAEVEEQLSGAVRGLMVSVEAYPDLKSNQNFLELQRELTDTEDRIANGRRYYNANVRNYNTQIEAFPSNFVANMFHFEKATYFEVNDQQVRQAPQVSFGEISQRPGSEPSNEQLGAPPSVAGLPNPQAYDQGSLGAPAPGGFEQVPAAQPYTPPAQPAYTPPPAAAPYTPPAEQSFQQPPAAPQPPATQPYTPPSAPQQPPSDPPNYAPPAQQ